MTVWYNSAAGITQYSQRSSRLLASANPLQFVSLWFCLSEGGHLKQRGGGREGERERERERETLAVRLRTPPPDGESAAAGGGGGVSAALSAAPGGSQTPGLFLIDSERSTLTHTLISCGRLRTPGHTHTHTHTHTHFRRSSTSRVCARPPGYAEGLGYARGFFFFFLLFLLVEFGEAPVQPWPKLQSGSARLSSAGLKAAEMASG